MDISFKDEIWKDVVDHPQYMVSNIGRVYSKRSNKLLKLGRADYLLFIVSVNNNRKTLNVHREVAKAFLGPYPNGMEVAHLDGNPHNNDVNNLKYVTAKENQSHRKIHGTDSAKTKNGRAVLTESQVKNIRSKYKPFKYGAPQLAKEFGIGESQVYRIVKGEQWI